MNVVVLKILLVICYVGYLTVEYLDNKNINLRNEN